MREHHPERQQHAEYSAGGADRFCQRSGQVGEQNLRQAGRQHTDEVKGQEAVAAPDPFDIAAEHR